MGIKGKSRKKSHGRSARPGTPRRTATGSASRVPRLGITLLLVGGVALVIGVVVGWAVGRSGGEQHLSGAGRTQMRSYQGRVDQALDSILQPLGQGGNFIAFADLLTDADAFDSGDLPAGGFRGTAQNASSAAGEAASTLETIPIGAVVDSLPSELGAQVGFSLVQFKQSLALYGQAADLFVLATQTEGDMSKSLMAKGRALREQADAALKGAFAEYNSALNTAGLTPKYAGEAATPLQNGGGG